MVFNYSEEFKEKVNHNGNFNKSKIRTGWPQIFPMPTCFLLQALNMKLLI